MPARNVVKNYIKGGHYHIYNRGVLKNKIFVSQNDYAVFLHYLRLSLDPNLKTTVEGFNNKKNLSNEVELLAYCLMPNHFHLLLKQNSRDGITKLLRHALTSYAMYFNKKYNRQGGLFQGKPRGVVVTEDPYLLHLTRYIHLNPLELKTGNFQNYPYSSYLEYTGVRKSDWVKPDKVLAYFKTTSPKFGKLNSYEAFVEGYEKDPSELLGNLTLD